MKRLMPFCLMFFVATGFVMAQAPDGVLPKNIKVLAKNVRYETSFIVYPADANHNYPMLFGGKALAEMDRCAGVTVRRLLYNSPFLARGAVTVGITDIRFHKAGQVKDLLFVTGKVTKLGQKSITVHVAVERELPTEERELLVDGTFTFCSYDVEA